MILLIILYVNLPNLFIVRLSFIFNLLQTVFKNILYWIKFTNKYDYPVAKILYFNCHNWFSQLNCLCSI